MDIQIIQNKIYEIRGQRVMLDFDLAELYQVETRVLNQAVKRNIDRFPEDFMFQVTAEEWVVISSQFVMTSKNKRPKSALPLAFTEHGVVMLSSVLRSDIAVQTSVLITRAFVAMRQIIANSPVIMSAQHQKEMKELEAELAENAKIMEEKQKEYQQIKQQEENDWTKELKKLESEANYEELTKALPVTFIGDSVMLGAMNNLHETFPNSYFDSKESRSTYVGYQIISELKENNKLGDPVVIHLGTNGDCKNGCKEKIMDLLTDRTVFWINTTNMPSVNESLNELSTKYSNLHIIDWYTLSQGQKDWFYSDGIHLPPKGRREYTNIVYNAIYNVYKDNFKTKKDELIKEHKEELKNKTMFYGNDILFYNFEAIQTNFSDAKFEVKKEFSYLDLKASIEKAIAEDTLSKKIVIAFDNSTIISTKEYQELIELCKDSKLYIVSSGKPLDSLSKYDNVEVINFYSKIQKNKDYS